MFRILVLIVATLFFSSCAYHAKNPDYHAKMRRATRDMLSVDFVDLIVEQDDEFKEDYVVLSKNDALLLNEGIKNTDRASKNSSKRYYVIKNDEGNLIYVKEGE